MRYEDLEPHAQELIEQAYYEGLVSDKLYTFLVDNSALLVVPDEFPEMTGNYIKHHLNNLSTLEDFVTYLDETDNTITVEDFNEELLKDFNEISYTIIKEAYITEFMENEYERISKQFFRR